MAVAQMFRVLALCGYLLTLCFSVVGSTPDGLDRATAAMLGATICQAVYIVCDRRRGGISLMLGFFFTMLIAIPAAVQIQSQSFPFYSTYSIGQLLDALAVLGAFQVAYMVAEIVLDSRADRRRKVEAPLDVVRRAITFDPGPYWTLASVLTVLSFLIAVYLGTGTLMLTRVERSVSAPLQEGGRAQLLFVGRSCSLAGLLTCLWLLRVVPEARRVVKYLALFLAVAGVSLILNYPPSLARFQLFGSVIAIGTVLVSMFSTRLKAAALVGGGAFLILLFPATKALGRGESLSFSGAVTTNVRAYMVRVDFDGFKQIVDTTIYLSQGGTLRWGENFLGAALFWVPRSVWEGKPSDSGLLVSTSLGYPYTNVSNPLPAESLISFGFWGVVVVAILLAAVVGAVERGVRIAEKYYPLTPLYGMMAGFVVIIMRGSLNGVAAQFSSGIVIYGLAAWWISRRQGRSESGLLILGAGSDNVQRNVGTP